MKYEFNTSMFSKDIVGKSFFTEIKGNNSDNNEWILSIIKPKPVYYDYIPVYEI